MPNNDKKAPGLRAMCPTEGFPCQRVGLVRNQRYGKRAVPGRIEEEVSEKAALLRTRCN